MTAYISDGEITAQTVAEIKNGNVQLRNKFIKDYIPFILKVISSSVPGKENLKNSDEYSIGLIAFNEAIEKFDMEKSGRTFNFFSFAEQIIKRRIIDYIRVMARSSNEIPFSYFSEGEGQFEEKYLKDHSVSKFERLELFQEIKHYGKSLESFGLRISELHKFTPKHRDSREMCISIARKIAENKSIYERLIKKKYFPMKELSQIVDVNPRTIERNREFIISVMLIYVNGYEHLQSYLGNTIYGREKNVR